MGGSEAGSSNNKAPKPAAKMRVMSGARTTAKLHIGNYFGAVKNWIELQDQAECFFGMMDWHAMTTSYKTAKEVRGFAREIFAEVIAWGLDPERTTLFIQSQVPEHIELFTYFMNVTPMGWLERVPTWKDAEEEAKANDTHNLGRFSYPVLQAADIAMYRGTHVPVGQDQVAHLELSREIIRRFNHIYGTKLPEPKPLLTSTPLLLGGDGRKMSKSYGNVFNLTQEEAELTHNVKMMTTDPKRVRRNDPGTPEVCPVYAFHKLFSSSADLDWVAQGCRTAGIGCGDCKKKLAGNINELMAKPREKKKQLLQDTKALDSIIANGCQKARKEAQVTLEHVRDTTGF